jgi:Fe-S-cluster-containing dehydrogenase component
VGTVATILFNGLPKVEDLDNNLRPLAFYGKLVHDNCPLRTYFDAGKFARKPGEEGCLYELGCKGPITYADCPIRHWNNGTNWCIGAGAPCNGCTQSEFPDLVSPFYQSFYEVFYDRLAAITKAGVLVHDTELCAGCGVCGLMCSLYHEGVQGPALARVETTRDPFTGTITFNACQQCLAPSCYLACPKRDRALCIDEETGCVYVNEAECDACGEGVAHCTQVCPLDPPRIRLKWKPYLLTDQEEKEVVFKCDLCRGRKAGPICVEFCPSEALTYVPRSER